MGTVQQKGSALMSRGEDTRTAIKQFIRDYFADNGVSPSLTEIAEGVGLASHNAVRSHLLVLKARGEVTWQDGKYRTIRVVDIVPARRSAAKVATKRR